MGMGRKGRNAASRNPEELNCGWKQTDADGGYKNNTIRFDFAQLSLTGQGCVLDVSCSWMVICVYFLQKRRKRRQRPTATKGIEPRISRIPRIKKGPFNPDSELGPRRKDAKAIVTDMAAAISQCAYASHG
jgi:hypothetical protein